MRSVDEIIQPLKEVDNFPEYFDTAYDTLEHLLEELKENDLTREPNHEEPQYWDFAITVEGMEIYDKARNKMHGIAIEKFGEDEIYDFPDVIEYA